MSSTDLTFGDNDKAIFGAGSDLQIYHDGLNSYISEQGSGNLFIQGDAGIVIESQSTGENFIAATYAGPVTLFYANAAKLATTNTGIDVTGTVTADGLTVDGNVEMTGNPVISNSSPEITFETTGPSHANWQIAAQENLSNAFEIASGQQDADASDDTWTKRFTVLNNGDIRFYDSTGVSEGFFYQASTQRLGLGTSSPAYKLDVSDAIRVSKALVLNPDTSSYYTNAGTLSYFGTTNAVYLNGASSGILKLSANGNRTCSIELDSSNTMEFITDSTERMRIDSDGKVIITKTAVAGSQTASVTGSTTLDFGTYQNFILTLTGNITLANPTTEQVGQSGFITFIQTGGYTVSLGTDYETAGGAGITLSASGTDVVPYIVVASGRILLGAPQLAFA